MLPTVSFAKLRLKSFVLTIAVSANIANRRSKARRPSWGSPGHPIQPYPASQALPPPWASSVTTLTTSRQKPGIFGHGSLSAASCLSGLATGAIAPAPKGTIGALWN